MDTTEIWILCVFIWIVAFAIWVGVGDGIKVLFCKHDYEEVYRHESYDRKEDMETGLTNGIDVGYVCKKCKKVKCASVTFQPICERNRS